jgi:hypothetical protein
MSCSPCLQLCRGSPRLSTAPLGPYAAVGALQVHLALVAHGLGRRARSSYLGRERGLQRTVGTNVRRHPGVLFRHFGCPCPIIRMAADAPGLVRRCRESE